MYVSSVRLRYRYIVMVVQLASINANLSGSRFGVNLVTPHIFSLISERKSFLFSLEYGITSLGI